MTNDTWEKLEEIIKSTYGKRLDEMSFLELYDADNDAMDRARDENNLTEHQKRTGWVVLSKKERDIWKVIDQIFSGYFLAGVCEPGDMTPEKKEKIKQRALYALAKMGYK